MEPTIPPFTIPPLLAIAIETNGKVHIDCHIPKLEAVKLLLNVIEELRLQGYEEGRRIVQPAKLAAQ